MICKTKIIWYHFDLVDTCSVDIHFNCGNSSGWYLHWLFEVYWAANWCFIFVGLADRLSIYCKDLGALFGPMDSCTEIPSEIYTQNYSSFDIFTY